MAPPSSTVAADQTALDPSAGVREGRAPRMKEPSHRIDAQFPEQFVDRLSRQEVFNKHLFRPNTYLHKWWARRCGSTFRTILKQFAPSAERTDYYTAGGLEGLTVLDPMMGGGTTLHEAIRLGANVVGADIDPIPVLQARSSLSRVAFPSLRTAFNRFLGDLHADLHPYFQTHCPTCATPTDIRYCLYGLRKRCACGTVIQVEQYDLRQDDKATTRFDPRNGAICGGSQPCRSEPSAGVREGDTPRMEEPSAGVREGDTPRMEEPSAGVREGDTAPQEEPSIRRLKLIKKGDKKCPVCDQAYRELRDEPFYARYILVAVVGMCPRHGLFYRAPSQHDLNLVAAADRMRGDLDFGATEDFLVLDGPKSADLIRHNVKSYLDVFSSRQLLYLHAAITHLQLHTDLERLSLAMLVSTSLEFNSMLCGYKGWYKNRPGATRHTFALHAYSFQYTALENNPVNPVKSSGNLRQLFHDRIERGRKWAAVPVERKLGANGTWQRVSMHGETDAGDEVFTQSKLAPGGGSFWVMQRDSRDLPLADGSVDIVVTDPPYYNSVQYADLASFFRVWLARLAPDAARWRYDHNHVAVAAGTPRHADNFLSVLGGIFRECHRVLKKGSGRMVFTFHHWDHNAWADLTIALQDAEFRLMNVYVVFSEHPISVHIRGLKSIRHDCILVLAGNGYALARSWVLPKVAQINESESFCRCCGETLGWLLDSRLPAGDVRDQWKRLLGNRG